MQFSRTSAIKAFLYLCIFYFYFILGYDDPDDGLKGLGWLKSRARILCFMFECP